MKFKDHVSLVIYGDDSAGSISPKVYWFDNIVIARDMKKYFNVEFTDPEKGQITTPFLESRVTFLCRGFEKRNGVIYAPLDWTSLSRLLYFYRDNGVVAEHEALLSNLDAFERELVHYAPDKRTALIKMVELAISKAGISYKFGAQSHWERRHLQNYMDALFLDY